MNHTFQIGDVVQLNDGSVDMTIVSISENDVVTQFIGLDGDAQSARWHYSHVRLVKPVYHDRLTLQEQSQWLNDRNGVAPAAAVVEAPVAEAPVAEAHAAEAPVDEATEHTEPEKEPEHNEA